MRPKNMKRAALLFLIFILVGWVFVPAAEAQTFNPIPGSEEFGAIFDDKVGKGQMSKEVYTANTQASYMNTGTCMITGCSKDPKSLFYYGKSSLALISGVIAGVYTTPPASFAYWLEDTGQSLGFIPKRAYAQGIGFSGFSALLPLWKVVRNIAYFLLAVVMIFIGFMVMLRKKIDPKTVVTVQNALPRIVLTLLLITFSYAIVGLLIDVMYLIMYLTVGLFVSSGLLPKVPAIWNLWGLDTQQKFFTEGTLAANTIQATWDVSVLKILGIPVGPGWEWVGSLGIGGILMAAAMIITAIPIPIAAPMLVAGGIAALTLPVLEFILSLAMLFLFIRLLIFFVGAYIQIVLALLFGPVQIMMEAVPGTNSFGSWLNNLIANMAVFPVGVVFFMLAQVFANFADTHKSLWAPNLSAISFNATSLSTLISLGILFAIPSVGKAIKEALKSKPMVSAGPGAIFAPLGGAVQTTMGTASQFYYGSAMVEKLGSVLKKKPTTP